MVVWPSFPEPERADAVVVLAGDGSRIADALRLMREGMAPTLLFVGNPDTQEGVDLCRSQRSFEVVCLRPQPDSTRQEARATGRYAKARGWKSIVLVSSRYHLLRARLLFRRCFDGRVEATGVVPPYGPQFARNQIRHEMVGVVYASLFARGC